MSVLINMLFQRRSSPTASDEGDLSDVDETTDLWEPLYETTVFNHYTMQLYVCQARYFCGRAVDNWDFNRKIDEAHVNSITQELTSAIIPHLLGTIKLVQYKNNGRYKVIDGQHRLAAISRITQQNLTWDMKLFVEIYDVEDENDTMISDLFEKANNNLNFNNSTDNPRNHNVVVEIVKQAAAHKDLCDGIIDTDMSQQSVYRPRITKKELFELFKKFFNPGPDVDASVIVNGMVQINLQLGSGTMPHKEIFKVKDVTKQQQQLKKAEKYHFYLNLKDSRYPPEVWIQRLSMGYATL